MGLYVVIGGMIGALTVGVQGCDPGTDANTAPSVHIEEAELVAPGDSGSVALRVTDGPAAELTLQVQTWTADTLRLEPGATDIRHSFTFSAPLPPHPKGDWFTATLRHGETTLDTDTYTPSTRTEAAP